MPWFDGFEQRDFEVNGVRIHARVPVKLPGDRPALLLLHGFPQTHVLWQRVAQQLAQDFGEVGRMNAAQRRRRCRRRGYRGRTNGLGHAALLAAKGSEWGRIPLGAAPSETLNPVGPATPKRRAHSTRARGGRKRY